MMKKATLLGLLMCVSILLTAQDENTKIVNTSEDGYIHKGLIYLGGTIAFNSFNSKDIRTNGDFKNPSRTYFDIVPEFGYLISNKFGLGLGLGYRSYVTKWNTYNSDGSISNELKDQSGMFIINPKIRFFRAIIGKLYCSSTLSVNMGFGKAKYQYLEYNFPAEPTVETEVYKQSEFGLSFRPAIMYFFSNHFAMTFSYGNAFFLMTTFQEDIEDSIKERTNSYGIDLSLNSIKTGLLFTF